MQCTVVLQCKLVFGWELRKCRWEPSCRHRVSGRCSYLVPLTRCLCWADTWLTGWERRICSVHWTSSWPTTSAWLCQAYATSSSPSCLLWRRKSKSTRISGLTIQQGKLRRWCSEYLFCVLCSISRFSVKVKLSVSLLCVCALPGKAIPEITGGLLNPTHSLTCWHFIFTCH